MNKQDTNNKQAVNHQADNLKDKQAKDVRAAGEKDEQASKFSQDKVGAAGSKDKQAGKFDEDKKMTGGAARQFGEQPARNVNRDGLDKSHDGGSTRPENKENVNTPTKR